MPTAKRQQMPLDKFTPLLLASRELAMAARLSYDFALPSGYKYDRELNVGDAQVRLMSNGSMGIVAIAGTNSASDWATNMQTGIHVHRGVELHNGFYKSATAVLSGLLSVSDLPECFTVGRYHITGHSMGAATACILPLLIDEHTRAHIADPLGVVGFGCPRYTAGDSAFLFDTPTLAICCPADPVTQVPMRFCRAGLQVYIDDDGITAHAGSEIARVLGYIARAIRLEWIAGKTSAANHDMELYERRVIRALEKLDR